MLRAGIIHFAFDKYDADGNGWLDVSELGKALSELTSEGTLTLAAVSAAVQKFDTSGDVRS